MNKHSSSLMTFAAYAQARNINPSTVSRQVASGKIPAVELEGGKRMIDPKAADEARRSNSNIRSGHGGKPDRSIRQQTRWRAKNADGFDPAQRAMLNVMRARWPDLLKRTMLVFGADELNAARAVLAVDDLTEWLAVALHNDLNAGRVYNYSDALALVPELEWEGEAAVFMSQYGRDPAEPRLGTKWWSSDSENYLDGGEELADEMLTISYEAAP